MSDCLLDHIHPDLRPLYTKLIEDLAEKHITARIIQGYRDPAYQDKLVSQGITKAPGSKGKHCCTLAGRPAAKAFDIGIFNEDGSYATNGNDVRYIIAGGLWRQYAALYPDLHLLWGGNFIHAKPDPDHFEMG